MTKISPSILSCDFGNLNSEIEMLNNCDADYLHIDVMDGVFVPNISFGFPIIEQINLKSKKPLDVHLMIDKPDNYISEFKHCGAYILTVHYESLIHIHRTIHEIKKNGMKAGLALNPHTPINLLHDIITDLDLVLIMSVNPGFGGQSFIDNSFQKIIDTKDLINKKNSKALIEVDGGVNLNNAKKLIDCGADILVAGSAVFNSQNPIETISKLKFK